MRWRCGGDAVEVRNLGTPRVSAATPGHCPQRRPPLPPAAHTSGAWAAGAPSMTCWRTEASRFKIRPCSPSVEGRGVRVKVGVRVPVGVPVWEL